MVSINKMLSCHAHFVLYLLQEIEFILSRTTSCICRHSIFSRPYYPIGLINSIIDMFIQNIATKPEKKTNDGNTIRLVLPFKDQLIQLIQFVGNYVISVVILASLYSQFL